MNNTTSLYSISEIEKKYPNWYSPDSQLSKDDQQWIWENLPLPQVDKQVDSITSNDNANVNGSVNGGYRFDTDSELIWHKSEAVKQLINTDYYTPPIVIAKLLSELFKSWPSNEGHWLYIAQTYTARTINWVVSQTIGEDIKGAIKTNPSRYFTFVIKHRTKRKDNKI